MVCVGVPRPRRATTTAAQCADARACHRPPVVSPRPGGDAVMGCAGVGGPSACHPKAEESVLVWPQGRRVHRRRCAPECGHRRRAACYSGMGAGGCERVCSALSAREVSLSPPPGACLYQPLHTCVCVCRSKNYFSSSLKCRSGQYRNRPSGSVAVGRVGADEGSPKSTKTSARTETALQPKPSSDDASRSIASMSTDVPLSSLEIVMKQL